MLGLLRVRNEARWIERCLKSIQPLCRSVIVLDDHSTDRTAEIARECGAVVISSFFRGLNEVRDKNYLLDQAAAKPGEWVLMIDGDEELHPDDGDEIRRVTADPNAMAFQLRVLYLWEREDQVRMDGVYGRFSRPSLWRYQPGQQFGGTKACGGFHCSNIPKVLWKSALPSNARLLHYGYLHRDDRIRKFHWYQSIDGDNRNEDGYRHMVIGDVFPAESEFKHAGPLKLMPLSEVE